ncbi:O-antigen ligase family protein [Owenweeksia hongkongensis]|uniref:O-antigen ligase family protein n=1 Tax=Owenweeksia hongkongensis TaxID=253245 RepID=UPI003A8D68D5
MEKLSIKQFFTVKGLPVKLLLFYPILIALISRQRGINDVTTVDSSAAIQIVFSLVVFIVCSKELLSNGTFRTLLNKSPLKWLLLYILLGLLSAFWSVDPRLTLYRAFENLSFLMLVSASIAILYRKFQSIDLIIKWILYYAVFLILAGTLKRALLWNMSFFSIETLLLEQMNSTPFFFLVLLLPVGLFLKGIILPISIFSLSNTAYFGMFAGSFALGKANGRIRFAIILMMVSLLIIGYLIGVESLLQETLFAGKEGVGLEYTTGRNKIFELSITEGLKSPFLGYGFVAGDTYIINKTFEGVIGAHNGFLSAFLGTGLIGLALFILFFVKMLLISKSKVLPKKYKSAFFATAILITVYTLGNPGLGTRVYGSWLSATLLFTMISIIYLHYKNNK